MLVRRAHEWAADQFRFVQYPRLRRRVYNAPDLLDRTLQWGVFAWLATLIWGSVLFWTAVVLVVLLA
jgi:hypothetical protein